MVRAASRFAAFAAVLMAANALFAAEEVLYWMVDNTARVSLGDGSTAMSIGDYFARYATDENASFAARIRVTGGDITAPTYLGLYYLDPDTGVIGIDDGELGVEFGNSGGYWGAGVPTGNQSPSGSYSAGDPEYAFIVELGNVAWDDDAGTASWVETIAESEARGYNSYLGGYIHPTFDVNPPEGEKGIWLETSFKEVPEPSGGLLLLAGSALLALRRRRFAAAP